VVVVLVRHAGLHNELLHDAVVAQFDDHVVRALYTVWSILYSPRQ